VIRERDCRRGEAGRGRMLRGVDVARGACLRMSASYFCVGGIVVSKYLAFERRRIGQGAIDEWVEAGGGDGRARLGIRGDLRGRDRASGRAAASSGPARKKPRRPKASSRSACAKRGFKERILVQAVGRPRPVNPEIRLRTFGDRALADLHWGHPGVQNHRARKAITQPHQGKHQAGQSEPAKRRFVDKVDRGFFLFFCRNQDAVDDVSGTLFAERHAVLHATFSG